MSFNNLPAELIVCIATNLDKAEDILSLACVNRFTYPRALRVLYKFSIKHQDSFVLHWAAKHRKTKMVENLLCYYRPNINAIYEGRTPLLNALLSRTKSTVTVLLARDDIDANISDSKGRTALCYAAYWGEMSIVQQLLRQPGIDVNRQDAKGQTPIFSAISYQKKNVAAELLSHSGIDPNWQDRRGHSPLIYATMLKCHTKRHTMMEIVLRQGINLNLNVRDSAGKTALHHAVRNRDQYAAQLLLKYGSDTHLGYGVFGETPLHIAIRSNNEPMVRMLVADQRFDRASHAFNDWPPLCLAAELGYDRIVQILLERGLNVNCADDEGQTPLHKAISCNHEAVVEVLLAWPGIQVNVKNTDGLSPLLYAIHCEHSSIACRLLREDSLDINANDKRGRTALHLAVLKKDNIVARELLAKEMLDPNIRDEEHLKTPLISAVAGGNATMVDMLLSRNDIQVNKHGWRGPPLWLAAYDGDDIIVKRLLEYKATDLNQKSDKGTTPLLEAINQGHQDVAKLLLEDRRRPDITISIWREQTALSLAKEKGFNDLVNRMSIILASQ